MDSQKKGGSKLDIFYQNVRGLRTKCSQLYNNILSSNYDLMCFTETWLQSDILDSEICDNRYDVFRCDRDLAATSRATGGGVMVCALRELCASVRSEWICESVESICVHVVGGRLGSVADLNIILVYLPPDDNLPGRILSFQNSFTRFYELHPNDNFLLVGDFNLPGLRWCDNENYSVSPVGGLEVRDVSLKFIDELTYLGLSQYNMIPNSCDNILDLCFCNLVLSVTDCIPLSKLDVFHPALNIVIFDLQFTPFIENPQPRYNFFKCNYDQINNYLMNINWEDVLSGANLDDAVDAFYNVLYTCFALYVPISTFNNQYPVWYSASLIKIIREKSKFHNKWKKYNNPRDRDTFSLLRNRQKRVQDACFKRFVNNSETLIKYTPKIFWKYVKSKRGGSAYPRQCSLGDQNYTDAHDICSAFNKFFESTFAASSSIGIHNHNLSVSSGMNVLSQVEVSESIVTELLRSVDKSKGSGCDRVPPIFLSSCAKSLAFPVTLLFRRSLKDCIVPLIWKKALVVPIHKKGSKSKVENYRPISILNTIPKLLEKLVYNSMYPIVTQGISEEQHGFIRGRSTISNLACFTEFVLTHMENGGQVDVVYTDFEKAFDRVDHIILLNKLNVLGIHGDLLRWVTSYLANRSQAVVLGGFTSEFISIPSGVPQGSHLGPLFYNAYIYDIYKCFDHAYHLLYADDKKIYMKIQSSDDCDLLQSDLNKLYAYYLDNKITVSTGKCQCISFTRKRNPIVFSYNFNGVIVERTEVVRDLGVFLDSRMSMTVHIDHITSRAFRNLGFVMRTCQPFNHLVTHKIVYCAYVRCILEYASSIWSPHYAIHINRIERIQKKFLSHINYKFKERVSSYINNCRLFKLLSLQERRNLLDMGLLFDILRGGIDCPSLLSGLSLCAPVRRTRHTPLFSPPFRHTNYGKNSVLARITHAYNNYFNTVDPFMGTKNSFKNKIFKLIFD